MHRQKIRNDAIDRHLNAKAKYADGFNVFKSIETVLESGYPFIFAIFTSKISIKLLCVSTSFLPLHFYLLHSDLHIGNVCISYRFEKNIFCWLHFAFWNRVQLNAKNHCTFSFEFRKTCFFLVMIHRNIPLDFFVYFFPTLHMCNLCVAFLSLFHLLQNSNQQTIFRISRTLSPRR